MTTTDGRYTVLFILEYWCTSWLKIILNVDTLWEYFSQVGKVDACTIMRWVVVGIGHLTALCHHLLWLW